LAIAGWITAVLIPLPVGMVIGAVLASRNDKRGRWILGVSVGVTLIWIVLVVVLLNTAEHQSSSSYYYE
jgi:ABC-type spermidine/putrescine transport system permease subunit I